MKVNALLQLTHPQQNALKHLQQILLELSLTLLLSAQLLLEKNVHQTIRKRKVAWSKWILCLKKAFGQTLLTTSLLVATHRSTWQLWLKSLKDRVQNSKSMVLDWLSSIESCTHLCIILPTTASFHRQWQAIETLLIFSFSAVRKYHPWHSLKLELLVG